MTLGGLLLLGAIVAVVVGFVKIKEQEKKISVLEKKVGGKKEGSK